MRIYVDRIIEFAVSDPLLAVVLVSTLSISIIALYFVLSRRRSPRSGTLRPVERSADHVYETVSEIIVTKDFIRKTVSAIVEAKLERPRFTLREFLTYAVPALIGLSTMAVILYRLAVHGQSPGAAEAALCSSISTYYFGSATANRV